MCSSATHSAVGEQQSTTWAASVPMDDLAHAIKVAVGEQPVRQLPPPALLKLAEQHQQQECCGSPTAAAASLSSSPTVQGASSSGHISNRLDTLQAPLPIRRPTLAEVRAASPLCEAAPDLCRLDSNSSSNSSSDSVCAELLAQQQRQHWSSPVAEPSSPVYFDEMDDVQQEYLTTALSSSSNSSNSDSSGEHEGAVAYLAVSSTDSCDAMWGSISKQQLLQQQQLLCKIWTELQLPVQHEDELSVQQQQQQPSPDSVLLLDASAAAAASQQNRADSANLTSASSSSCCSSVLGIQAAAGSRATSNASPRSSLESSCSASSLAAAAAAAAAAQASCCCSGACSTYAESCGSGRSSKSRQQRVSWGGVTEYYLPPAQKSVWDSVLSLVPASVGRTRSERQFVLAAAAAGLAVTVAGTAAIMCAKRRA